MKMHRIGYYLSVIVLSAGCLGKPYSPTLLQLEDIIQDDPATAYSMLAGVNKDSLFTPGDKALYSLLMSIALDKNYIDLQSDSIVAPAVRFYSSSPDHYRKFLSYYYLGRVQENAEDYTNAISSYIEAGKVGSRYIPLEYRIRLNTRKGTVYYHQFALDKALESYKAAKTLAESASNPAFYISSSLDVATTEDVLGNHIQAQQEWLELKQWLEDREITPPVRFYHFRLRSLLDHPEGRSDEIESAYADYTSACSEHGSQIDHALAADYYLLVGMPGQAETELASINPDNLDVFSAVHYYYTLSAIQQSLGKYEESLETHQLYETILGKTHVEIHNNDVRFLEERSRSEIEKVKSRHFTDRLIFLLLIIFGIVVALAVLIVRNKRQYEEELAKATAEYDFLRQIAEDNEEYPEVVRQTIDSRIQALRPYIYSGHRSSLAKAGNALKDLNGKRQDLLATIGLIYAAVHPGFVSRLSRSGLTAEEIGLCCMYVAGYSSKELEDIKYSNKLYQQNTIIRKKLGLSPNGEKLSSWLRELFEELNGRA